VPFKNRFVKFKITIGLLIFLIVSSYLALLDVCDTITKHLYAFSHNLNGRNSFLGNTVIGTLELT